jgi:pectate lyase
MSHRRRGLSPVALAGMLGLALSTPAEAEPRDIGRDISYSLGISTESAVYAENNAFTTPGHVEVADLVKSWSGTALHQTGTLFNGYPVDLLAIHNAYNSGSERDLTADVGWTPTLHQKIDSAVRADREVARGAGAGRLR